jgi:hypothetical protein
MIFRQRFLDGIRAGTVTLAFRRWRRPTVRSGGTLLTAAGRLSIERVRTIDPSTITDADAMAAGYANREELQRDLHRPTRRDGTSIPPDEGAVYRIDLGSLVADERVALRAQPAASEEERVQLLARLARLDARSAHGPWTQPTLHAIAKNPGVRAGNVCRLVGQEMLVFKANVRKLKALGLTESLEVGYRLSRRGRALLDQVNADV